MTSDLLALLRGQEPVYVEVPGVGLREVKGGRRVFFCPVHNATCDPSSDCPSFLVVALKLE